MDRVGVRELRLHASQYLRRVEAGETLEVTRRGRVIALIAPTGTGEDMREHLLATGQLVAGRGYLLDLEPQTTRGSVSQALAALRADER